MQLSYGWTGAASVDNGEMEATVLEMRCALGQLELITLPSQK
jgi:hypothetical protein